MEESILNTIKKLLGIDESDESFDLDIIVHINSVINALAQIGVEAAEEFYVEDDETKWEDLVGDTSELYLIKSYMYFMVRKMFDPPQSSSVMQALNDSINQLEWRISVTVDPKKEEEE